MKKTCYAKILLVIIIMIAVNVMPTSLEDVEPGDFNLEIYPKKPHNKVYLNNDITLTFEITNSSSTSKKFRLELENSPENAILFGRDGLDLPFEKEITGKQSFYYGMALIPTNHNFEGKINLVLTNLEGEKLENKQLKLEVLKPQLNEENIESRATEYGINQITEKYLIPKYRRYWHLNRDEDGKANPGYVWLVTNLENNLLIDDNSGELIARNIRSPNEIVDPTHGETKLWNGNNLVNLNVPTVKIDGDLSFTHRKFEVYYADWFGESTWVVRQIMYWQSGETPILQSGGPLNEIPDTERIELWISAKNGEQLHTISDFHHYSFRHAPVDKYIILDDVHCPLPSDVGWQMWFSAIANYNSIYPESEITQDKIGFTKYNHPLTRGILEDYWWLVRRNLIGIGLVCIVIIVPFIWNNKNRWISKDS
ncbi:MAG: hypothetical protein KGY45_03560 [Hadesarchaea archaeon]|nr:hypothetical protein [Hadesarchaea archaeon]